MRTWIILIIVSLIAWYLPVISFRNEKKYFRYFVVNSLVDPIYIVIRYTFHIGVYNYIPIALLCEAMFFPQMDSRSRTISAVALLLITFTLGTNAYLELIICESVLALMSYYLLKNIFEELKKDSTFRTFQLVLLIYFLRNALVYYLYYYDQVMLHTNYTVLLIIVIVIPVVIAYLGPKRILSMNILPFIQSKISNSNLAVGPLELIQFDQPEFLDSLTKTEIRVLHLLACGLDYKQISERMYISRRTVYFHIQNLKKKLNINSITLLRKFAIKNFENFPKTKEPAQIDSMKY